MTKIAEQPILVIGAGIAGVTSALEAAEAGHNVILLEREPSIGGRVARNHQYFPKLCPPSCGMEINIGRIQRNPRVRLMVNTEVSAATKTDSGWDVTVRHEPEYVRDVCTCCGDCSPVCPVKIPDPFEDGLREVSAIRPYSPDAFPRKYVLDRGACEDGCQACVAACQPNAIDLQAEAADENIQVASIVIATGWQPYPVENLKELGGDQLDNVVANVRLERMVAPAGPNAGKIVRPSDGAVPKRVAFVQCAGSRDVNHLPYCSGVCCLASLKQAEYVKEQIPEAEVTVYYIDRRTPGRNEDVLTKALASENMELVKGKVGKIEAAGGGNLVLRVEDIDAEKMLNAEADLVVLATGMMPSLRKYGLPFDVKQDEDGFVLDDAEAKVFVAGVSRRPEDVAASVRDATGAAAKAIAAALRSA